MAGRKGDINSNADSIDVEEKVAMKTKNIGALNIAALCMR